jgi:hypothetical protein
MSGFEMTRVPEVTLHQTAEEEEDYDGLMRGRGNGSPSQADTRSERSRAMTSARRFLWDEEGGSTTVSTGGGRGYLPKIAVNSSGSSRRGGFGGGGASEADYQTVYQSPAFHGTRSHAGGRNSIEGMDMQYQDAGVSEEAEEYLSRYRLNPAGRAVAYSRRPCVRRLVWLLLFVVVLVGCGHWLVGRQESHTDLDIDTNTNKNEDPVSTVPPLPVMTTIDESAGLDRYTVIRQMLLQLGINSPEQLDAPKEPQYHALEWIANRDAARLNVQQHRDDVIQRYILALFYFTTSGIQDLSQFEEDGDVAVWNVQDEWMTINSVCVWHGIECQHDDDGSTASSFDDHSSSVRKITLSGNNLQNRIPTELQFLPHLQTLDLSINALSGTLPEMILHWPSIHYLLLRRNQLTGTIPRIDTGARDSPSQVLELHLGENLLTGSIPEELNADHLLLTALALDQNHLEGSLPHFSNLSNLSKYSGEERRY